ncbi:MAG: YdcF family protein [Acutalibacteraceae bacterium]|nr:YdcF family protein [Acutalibacteraceae bacterium]
MNLITILLLLFILYALLILTLIIYFALKKPNKSDILIVLGCKVKGNQPSKSLKRRLDSAYTFLEKNESTYCIVSGGKGSDELISEAECMYRYLIKKGISPKRIIKEDKSTNTCENLINSFSIIKARFQTSNGVVIATDFYHHLRANIIAKKYGFKILGAVSSIPPVKTFTLNTLRELVAVPNEILKPKQK